MPNTNINLFKTDPEFSKLVQPLLTDIDQKTAQHLKSDRTLIPLIAMIVQGTTDLIEFQTQQALNQAVQPEKILEIVYQLTPVLGIPKVATALSIINGVFQQKSLSFTQKKERQSADFGTTVQTTLYGNEIKNLLKDLPDDAGTFIPKMLTEHFFNDHYRRLALSVKDRERFELMALITMNVDFQIGAHAKGSLKAGNSESELVWSAVQLLPYIGFPFVINSVQKIHTAALTLSGDGSK